VCRGETTLTVGDSQYCTIGCPVVGIFIRSRLCIGASRNPSNVSEDVFGGMIHLLLSFLLLNSHHVASVLSKEVNGCTGKPQHLASLQSCQGPPSKLVSLPTFSLPVSLTLFLCPCFCTCTASTGHGFMPSPPGSLTKQNPTLVGDIPIAGSSAIMNCTKCQSHLPTQPHTCLNGTR
jgi:hypothetical protein